MNGQDAQARQNNNPLLRFKICSLFISLSSPLSISYSSFFNLMRPHAHTYISLGKRFYNERRFCLSFLRISKYWQNMFNPQKGKFASFWRSRHSESTDLDAAATCTWVDRLLASVQEMLNICVHR